MFVSRVGVSTGVCPGSPFAWWIESVFAEFPKVLLSKHCAVLRFPQSQELPPNRGETQLKTFSLLPMLIRYFCQDKSCAMLFKMQALVKMHWCSIVWIWQKRKFLFYPFFFCKFKPFLANSESCKITSHSGLDPLNCTQ